MVKLVPLILLFIPVTLMILTVIPMALVAWEIVGPNCMPHDLVNPRFWQRERKLRALVFKRFTKPMEWYGYRQEYDDTYGILWRMHADKLQPIVNHARIRRIPRFTGEYVDWARRAVSRQCIIEVKDATSGETHYLAVPNHCRTAREGVAWTFGLSANEYKPVKQT